MKQSKPKENRYAGLMKQRYHLKYSECEYVRGGRGNKVRLLTAGEVDEFKAGIQRVIDPSLRQQPRYRKAVV